MSGRRILIRVVRMRRRVLALAGLFALLIALGLDQSLLGVGGASPAAAAGGSGASLSVERESAERRLVPEGESGIRDGRFGSTVALSGDGSTALIGAPYEDGGPEQGEGPGSVWVFMRSAGQWSKGEQLEMPVADSAPGACGGETKEEAIVEGGSGEVAHACRYGISVALSQDGDTAVIGAPHVQNNSGAVFIFTRSASASGWSLAAELTSPNEETKSRFGRSVAISAAGTTVLVGAPIYPGRAWVFTGSGSSWTESAELADPAKSQNGGEGGVEGKGLFGPGRENQGEGKGLYGQSIALSADGQTALIGAPGYAGQKGAAWVFHDFGQDETPTHTRLEAAAGEEHEHETAEEKTAREAGEGEIEREARFGISVALSGDGDTAMVGAPGYEGDKGAAWVFTGAGTGAWPEQAELTGAYATKAEEEADGEEQLGASIALSYDGDIAVIGAPLGYSGNAAPTEPPGFRQRDGVAWQFERSTSLAWSAQRLLRPYAMPHPEVHFGSGVALSGSAETRLVGGRADEHQGAAWVFGSNPSVETVQPNKGPAAGGTTVTITGEHLTEATAVRFGETDAREVSVAAGGKSLTAVSPPGTGTVEVSVETPIGTSAANPPGARFTYVAKGGEGGGKEPVAEPTVTSGNEAGNGSASGSGAVLAFGPTTGGGTGVTCGVSLLGKSITVQRQVQRHGRAKFMASLRLTQTGKQGSAVCRGTLTLQVKVKSKIKAKGGKKKQRFTTKTIGSAGFTIAPGKTKTVTITLNPAGRALLAAGHGRLGASLVILRVSPRPAHAQSASVRLVLQKTKRHRS